MPVVLLLLLIGTPSAFADSLFLSTPSWSIAFPAALWRLADTAALGATYTLTDSRGHRLTLSGGVVPAGSHSDSLLLASAAAALAAPPNRLEPTLDSTEVLGSHAFTVREWRDPEAAPLDSLKRARVYWARRGSLHLLATLRYRSGGCGSTLFSLRKSLQSLVLGDPLAALAREPAVLTPSASPSRDALGRRRASASVLLWSPSRAPKHGAAARAKTAGSACADRP